MNITEVRNESYTNENRSMNVSDLNSSMFEMYIVPWNHRDLEDGFKLSDLNFTWECVYF